MPAGRPTKYTKELITQCHEYLDTYHEQGDMIPSHEGMFLFVGISSTCGYDWAKEKGKEEFSEILAKCMQMQKQELINKGLSNEFNSNITKLVLGKHGLHDRQSTELTGADGDPIKTESKWQIEIVHTDAKIKDTE